MDQRLMDLMVRMASEDSDAAKRKPRPLPEAQIARLKEMFDAYTSTCSYGVGDVVTPRSDAPVSGAGTPHLVVAVRQDAPFDFECTGLESSAYGRRRNMRVITFCDSDRYHAHWVESADFEPFVLASERSDG